MTESQEKAFSQAIASVSLETQTLTEDIKKQLKEAIEDNLTVIELLDLLGL